MRLKGRRALVTGSSRGIGVAIALRLLDEGARVVANSEADDADAARARRVLGSRRPGDFAYVEADVAATAGCRRLVEAAVNFLGGLDLLVNCAAQVGLRPLSGTDDEFLDRVLDTNLRGPLVLCREAAPHLARVPGACVVNIGSSSGVTGTRLLSAYSASKGGLHALTRALARELGPAVRVNAVVPGWIQNAAPPPGSPFHSDFLDYIKGCPLGRAGREDEVAAVVAFLASEDASYLNGQIVVVDGGFM